MPNTRALVLLSGGLDSMLAIKVLQAQGIEVEAVSFASNFFNTVRAEKAAEQLKINLRIIDITKELLSLVKNPPSGYGKNMNPCIDCHAMMLRIAYEKFSKEFDIIATGEVVGQRPFSQNKEALLRVQKLAGFEILRPLSAKLLPETKMETDGIVNRGRLLNISGRQRERQMELAEKYNILDYPSPAGGCLLTDPEFSQRLMDMVDNWPNCTDNDVELLKNGRVKWFHVKNSSKQKILTVIGRNAEENDNLERLAQKGDIMIRLREIPGPNTILRSSVHKINHPDSVINIDLTNEVKISQLGLNEEKNIDELIKTVSLYTTTFVNKAQNKKIEIEIINYKENGFFK